LRRRCLWCGTMFLGRQPECPSCGLDSEGPVARELADLEIAATRIQRLVDTGQLDSAVGEQVYKSLEARQSQLLKGVAQQVPAFLPETGPPLDRLERLLSTCRNVRNLTFENRKRALEWYRQLEDAELERLSPASLLALARLLRMAALSSRALG